MQLRKPGRTRILAPVEFLRTIERGGRVFPVEVKMTGRPRPADFKGLRVFLGEYGKAAPRGVLLHTGRKAGPGVGSDFKPISFSKVEHDSQD